MTATRKLLVAALLVSTGFGVAALLGKPELVTPFNVPALPQSSAAMENRAPTNPYSPAAVRLAPDYAPVNLKDLTATEPVDAAPALISSSPSQLAQLQSPASVPDADRVLPHLAPRAKLRNEAPRPLAVDSEFRDDVTPVTPFEQAPQSTPVIRASFDSAPGPRPVTLPSTSPVTPPPWPEPEANEQPRMHLVVDGDSLARLAGRYLDDPRRAEEIFAANRGILSDPELLPIGAELVIPSRSSKTDSRVNIPQSCLTPAVAVNAPDSGRLVPVRPVPSAAEVLPRAQLSHPLRVE